VKNNIIGINFVKMKEKLLFMLLPRLLFGKTRIGGCIYGGAAGDERGEIVALSYDGKL